MSSWLGVGVTDADPASIRRSALADLADAVGADAALYHGYARRRGGGALLVAAPVAVGDSPLGMALEAFDGFRFADLETRLDDAAPFGGFALFKPGSVPEPVRRNFAALGLGSGLGANFASAGRVVGSVYAYRREERPSFSDGDVRVADALVGPLSSRLERAALLDESAAVHLPVSMFTPEGEVRFVPEGAGDLLPDVGRLGEAVRIFASGGRSRFVGGGSLHQLAQVQGANGPLVCVWSCPVDPLPVHPAMLLSPARRRVASLAARGATVPEIASALDRSPETVRTHLKHVYGVLGVGTRVQLSALVSGVWA